MLDLVGIPEDQFSYVAAHIIVFYTVISEMFSRTLQLILANICEFLDAGIQSFC